jgi:AcrR family transcriptional regulator
MPRAGLSTATVVQAAAELADEQGLQAVTLAQLARRLGVRSPSLYAHIGGLDDLLGRVAASGAEQLTADLQAAVAGRSGEQALRAFATTYRDYAREHPGSYAALQRGSLAGAEQAREASGALLGVVLAVLRGYELEGERALHMARVLRSALHGFVQLEAQEGFAMPLALEDSFAELLGVLERGLGTAEA